MTPPEAPATPSGNTPPAASACAQGAPRPLLRLRQRADFLAAARARRQSAPGLTLQARRRAPGEAAPAGAMRVGFTCSKKIGNAVARNRAKRRLRAAARAVLAAQGRPGWDYVLIGRPGQTVSRDYAALERDLAEALARLHAPRPPRPDRGQGPAR